MTASDLRTLQARISELESEVRELRAEAVGKQELEQSYRELAEHSADVLWVASVDRRQLFYVSPAFETIWGRPIEDAVRSPFAFVEFIHPDDRANVLGLRDLQDVGESPREYTHEYRILRPDGEIRWIWTRVVPVVDADGEVTRVAGISSDITARKQAEEGLRSAHDDLDRRVEQRTRELSQTNAKLRDSESQLRIITDNLPAFVSYVDKDERYRFVNKRYEDWFGRPAEEILGRHLKDVLGSQAYERIRDKVAVALSGEQITFEQSLPFADGRTRDFVARFVPDVADEGVVRGYFAMITDVTKQKLAEGALRETEQRFRLISANIDEVFWLASPDETELYYVSEAFERVTGYCCDDLYRKPMSWHDTLHPEDRSRLERMIEAEPGPPSEAIRDNEYRLFRRDGELRWVWTRSRPVYDDEGALVARAGVAADITERKVAELSLRDSEQRFRQLAENIQEVFWITSADGEDVIYVSPAYERIWGQSCESLYESPRNWFKSIDPEDQARVEAAFYSNLKPEPFEEEYRIIRPDGAVRWIRDRGFPVVDDAGRITRVVGIADDITDRKESEQALRESESHFRRLLEAQPDSIIITDAEGRIILANAQTEKTFGHTREEIIGQPVEVLVPQAHRAAHVGSRTRFVADKQAREAGLQLEIMGLRKDGAEFPADMRLSLLETDRGLFVMSTVRDITQRKEAQEALRQEKELSAAIIKSGVDGILAFDREFRYSLWNPGMEEISGYAEDEVLGQCAFDVFPFLVETGEDELFRRALAGETFVAKDRPYSVPGTGKQGFFEGSYAPLRDEAGEVIGGIAVLRDTTERKLAEEQARLLQTDLAYMSRLTTMGEIASGLAHELSQPLTAINNYARGCIRRLGSNGAVSPEMLDVLERIASEARRTGKVIRGLSDLVRRHPPRKIDVDMTVAIDEIHDLAAMEAKLHHAVLSVEIAAEVPAAPMDKVQIQQVLLNLVQNAGEALEAVPPENRKIEIVATVRDSVEIEIVVTDSGPGLPPDELDKIFERFHTTKKQGMGMGLAISRSIVEAHGGRLWATSEKEGSGASFHFTLPVPQGDQTHGSGSNCLRRR